MRFPAMDTHKTQDAERASSPPEPADAAADGGARAHTPEPLTGAVAAEPAKHADAKHTDAKHADAKIADAKIADAKIADAKAGARKKTTKNNVRKIRTE